MKLTIDGKTFEVSVGSDMVAVDGRQYAIRVERRPEWTTVYVDDRPVHVARPAGDVSAPGQPYTVLADAREYTVQPVGRERAAPVAVRPAAPPPVTRGPLPPGAIAAHMTGRVLRIEVSEGQVVAEGDLLLVLEAMKMENEIRSPRSGTVSQLNTKPGERVQEGALLLVVS